MPEKSVPLRMCLACRESKPKRELLRIVKNESGIHLDFSGKSAGRGAYLCNSEACVKKLIRYKLINKAFSCEVDAAVYLQIQEEFLEGKN